MLPTSDTRHLVPLLTPQALCIQLSISYRTYSRLVRAGMPFVRVLTARRYDVAEVEGWLRTRRIVEEGHPRMRQPMLPPGDDQLVWHLKLLARGRR